MTGREVTDQNGVEVIHITDVAVAAREYLARGWAPLPFRQREKGPTYPDWQNFKADETTQFSGMNLGLLDGAPSNGLVDCDLDCSEALALAPLVLPATGAIFGRQSKPRSHWLYRCDPPPETQQFQFDKAMLVELRSTGVQTMAPPSVHPCGEVVRWDADGDPAEIPAADLARCMGDLAALCLLVRHWPEPHGRYNAEGALIGALLRAGRTDEDVERLITAIQQVAGAARQHRPEKSVPRLAKMLAAKKPVPGLKRLKELLGADIADKVAEWMGLRRGGAGGKYEERADGIYMMGRNKDGELVETKLCNFTAEITEVIERDDGSGAADRRFIVKGARGSIEVPADEFDGMGWVTTSWGPWASVTPGQMMKPHAAQAIKVLSEETEERVVFTHAGWRQIDGRWLYLHAGGAIGADGPVDGISVELDGELHHALLLPIGDLQAAVQMALKVLDLSVPAAAAAWRAPLIEFYPIKFSAFTAGQTGIFKSARWGIAQAFWGSHWDGVRFPANWTSTANANEKIAHTAKDMLVGYDDFVPPRGRRASTDLHEKVERLVRSVGNLAGRGRMRSDTTLMPEYPPRCLPAITGEDVPGGHSLRARMFIEQLELKDTNLELLTELQEAAADGILAEAMAGYVQWLAGWDEAELREYLPDHQLKLRKKIVSADHSRTPDTVASLMLGVGMFTRFAQEVGAISEAGMEALNAAASAKLLEGVKGQVKEQKEEDPIQIFVEAVPMVLAAGMCHVTDKRGDLPGSPDDDLSGLGWTKQEAYFGKGDSGENLEETGSKWRPQRDRIGWVEGGDLHLFPDVAMKAVNQLLAQQGGGIAISRAAMARRLNTDGWLKHPEGEKASTVTHVAGSDKAKRVWVMDCEQLGVTHYTSILEV